MVFVAKKPHLYIPELEQQTTEIVNVGLYFGTTISTDQAQSWLALARAIRQTTRSIRCLWLRFANGDDSVLSTLRSFGQELVGCLAVQSLILENRIGTAEIMCLKDYFTSNTSLRGIKFLRTNLDTSAFVLIHDFFARNGSLRVLDVFGNSGVGDECIREMLGAILVGESNLETLNIGEINVGDEVEGVPRITESGVEAILSFVRRTPSIAYLRIRLRAMSNTRLIELANILQSPACNISRLELCGSFGDEGIQFLAEALKTNRTVKTISIGVSENLTDRGGRQLLQVCQDRDGTGSWDSVIRSNHTLRSVFISEKHAPTMTASLITKLQSLTSEPDPHQTLQAKAWNFIKHDMDCLPNLKLKMRHMPYFLSFVATKGGHDCLFLVLSRGYFPDLLTNPSPEKLRLRKQMKRIEYENESLRTSLERELLKNKSLRQLEKESNRNSIPHQPSRRIRKEKEQMKHWYEKHDLRQCCLQPFIKIFEAGKMMVELLKEIYRI